MNQEDRRELIKALILLVFLVTVFLFLHYSGLHERYLTPIKLRQLISSAGILAPLIFIALYALPIFSDSVFAMIGGGVFGPWLGTLLSITGAAFSTSLAFFISRWLGRSFVARYLKGGLKLFDDDMEKHGFKIIFFLRLIPIFPYEGINYGAGLTKIRYSDYLLATILGIIPGAFMYNFLGSSLAGFIDPFYIIPVYLVLFVIVGPLLIRHYRKRGKSK